MIPVQKMPITDQVVEKIKASIIDGTYKEHAKLPSEQALCIELNVSRSTIREAFRVLKTMGYVELKPGRGAFVSSATGYELMNVRDWFRENAPRLKDFIEVREAIETLAVKIAIEKGSPEEYKKVNMISSQFLKALDANDVAAMAHLDETFHETIVNMTHNSLLININNLVSKEFKKYRSISFAVRANAESALESHKLIVDSLMRRDTAAATESMVYHLHRVVIDMESLINE